MALNQAPRAEDGPGRALTQKFGELGLTREFLRRMTERGDDLRHPLTPTRMACLLDDDATVVLRLFFCGVPTDAAQAEAALGSALFETSRKSGLLIATEDGLISSPLHLRLVRGLYLFSDYLGSERDAVMGAGETTGLLYQASNWNRKTQRVLDLGCGAGTLAILLGQDAEFAIGTDINERAVALGSFNASVNGISNVEFRAGSLFEPVAGETFDLIGSQPPYYPAPAEEGTSLVYLHGGIRGDELALQIIRDLGTHLDPNGRALIFTSWPVADVKTAPEGMRVLELTTNGREVHGTRQSLNILEHALPGSERWSTFEVPADNWGAVQPWRIDELLVAENFLKGPEQDLLNSTLRLPADTATLCEGDQRLLSFPESALLGCVPVEDQMWKSLQAVHATSNIAEALRRGAAFENVREALRRGWLIPTSESESRIGLQASTGGRHSAG